MRNLWERNWMYHVSYIYHDCVKSILILYVRKIVCFNLDTDGEESDDTSRANAMWPSGSRIGAGGSGVTSESMGVAGVQSTHREAAPSLTETTSLCQDLSNTCTNHQLMLKM